jgi:hypothetical protein
MKSSAKVPARMPKTTNQHKRNPNKMKAIRMRIQKSSRPLVILLATVVAIITSVVVANATQTITTPNAAFISYNLAAGANSAAITPAASRSVLIMGCSTTNPAVAQVTLIRVPSFELEWVGFEQNGAVSKAASAQAGTHIVSIDASNEVNIVTASIDTIIVHNGQNRTMAGNVTLIW